MPAATLLDFARANDAAAATPAKLLKQQALADYLRPLDDEADLRLAVRFAAGRAFASTDERVLNLGGRIVTDVILDLLGLDPRAFHDLVVRSGEIGEALSVLWPNRPAAATPCNAPLTLHDLGLAFDDMAATGNVARRKQALRDLLARCAEPREATYLAKIIFRDMRTGVAEGVLQAAVAQAFGKKLAEVQRAQLLVGDLDEVAVLAKRDALCAARFRLFHPIQFMLATPQEAPADAAATMAGRPFFAEDKLDGIRAQVHKTGEGAAARVAIYTRTMDRADASFPEVVEAVAGLGGEFLLDGEIVPWADGRVLPFAHVQKRLGRKVVSARTRRENPVAFVAFDILYRDGELLMERPLRDRRAALGALVGAGLLTTELAELSTAEEIDAAFAAARERRNEGVVLKDPASIYAPGRRGKMWLKLKTHLPTFDCVVTAAEYGHGKRRAVLSDYTFAVWDRDPADPAATLVNVGKAFTGLTDEEIAQLTPLFLGIARGQRGRVFAVEPKVVLEIAADQIQVSARHASGYALRFPRIKRVRWDKSPADADRLDRIREIHRSAANTAHDAAHDAAPAALPAREPTLFDAFPGDEGVGGRS